MNPRKMNAKRGRGRPKGKASLVRAAKAVRVETALELRVSGFTIDQIAERLGVSHAQAHADVSAALAQAAERTKDKAEELRELGVARCEAIVARLMDQAENPKAAAVILKAEDRRAKLLGLDVPKRLEHSGTVNFGFARDQLAQAIARLAGGSEPSAESEAPPGAGPRDPACDPSRLGPLGT